MRTIIITICLLLLGITVQAQQALQKYYTATQALEGQADSEEKSKTRGKALAVFHDERVKEAGTETAKTKRVNYSDSIWITIYMQLSIF